MTNFSVQESMQATTEHNVKDQIRTKTTKIKEKKHDLKFLIIDHDDSYTYNLYDLVESLCTYPPLVLSHDDDDEVWNCLEQDIIDGIILSPGPGRPDDGDYMKLTREVIRRYPQKPILGVCLGHQALGYVYGGTITEAPEPVHGQIHPIKLLDNNNIEDDNEDPSHLFSSLPNFINVTRYHSLIVSSESIPSCLKVTASFGDIVMGLQHVTNPHYGVQFHPESIGTLPEGATILKNFCEITESNVGNNHAASQRLQNINHSSNKFTLRNHHQPIRKQHGGAASPSNFQVKVRTISNVAAKPSDVFKCFYESNPHALWLDSSSASLESSFPRWSILAGRTGSLSKTIAYYSAAEYGGTSRIHLTNHLNESTIVPNVTILEYLKAQLASINISTTSNKNLPFLGGYLGYLGYEVRHDLARKKKVAEKLLEHNNVPTATFLFSDQSMLYDHSTGEWHLIELTSADTKSTMATSTWLETTAEALKNLPSPLEVYQKESHKNKIEYSTNFISSRSKEMYQRDIAQCHEYIRQGESYELCLTNHLETSIDNRKDPLTLYQHLRNNNPAPFSAYLHLSNAMGTSDNNRMAICCSSPERFLSVRKKDSSSSDWIVEAKPIKGTAPRNIYDAAKDAAMARSLELCPKNRAENLMIVDLLRHDLTRVCSKVHVPKLMSIETYATVHQMVSTIRGILREGKNALDVIQACFPGGSMTGAPKVRTMELLQDLEQGKSRGPYAGCLGYVSLDGHCDLNILIRTAVLSENLASNSWKVQIGAGGAITALSESQEEYDEMLLKARAVKRTIEEWAVGIED